MTNAELISMVRSIAKHGADWRINEVLNRAADALEAAEKRIKELETRLPKEGEWLEDDTTYCAFREKDGHCLLKKFVIGHTPGDICNQLFSMIH